MIRRLAKFVLLLSLASAIAQAGGVSARESRWTFNVYLNDSRIGYHDYRLVEGADGVRRIEANARFDVKILFVNAFRYRHEIAETWDGNCLVDVEARTNSNGKKTLIEGQLTDAGFLVEAGETAEQLGQCVMTFAYWNPEFLNADRLLNPQTGEFLDVDIEPLGSETLLLNRREIDAVGYQIEARDLTVRVWYSEADQRWVALESPTKGGRVLRYELST